jgi:hypothetical protein
MVIRDKTPGQELLPCDAVKLGDAARWAIPRRPRTGWPEYQLARPPACLGDIWEAASAVPGVLPQAFAATAVNGSVVVVDHYRRGAWADPDVSWRALEPSPTAARNCDLRLVTAGAVAVFSQCGETAAVDASGQWLPLTPSTGVEPRDTVVVSTGDQLLVWGRDFDAHQPVMRSFDLAVLR